MQHISGPNLFEQEVSGESKYQKHLEHVAGGRDTSGANHIVEAVLICEDSNRYDRNAVRVDIEGGTVGYLPRVDAKPFRKWLSSHGISTPVECLAVIVGGWKNDRSSGHFGVRLDIEIGGPLSIVDQNVTRQPKSKSGCGFLLLMIAILFCVVVIIALALKK